MGFRTKSYGSYNQTIVFGFGPKHPLVKRDIKVEVICPEEVCEGEAPLQQDDVSTSIIASQDRWDQTNATIVDFDPPLLAKMVDVRYPMPQPSRFKIEPEIMDPLTIGNYRKRMHHLLDIEEMAQFKTVSRFNLSTKLQLTNSYLLTTSSLGASQAKYARPGEIFGKLSLGNKISQDTPSGRVLLTNCNTVLIAPDKHFERPQKAYVAEIEDSLKTTLYLRLSKEAVKEFNLRPDEEFEVKLQFQLNRVPILDMHHAVDALKDLRIVYPDVENGMPGIPWTPGKQWSGEGSRLNPKQKEAVMAITAPMDLCLPPVLIVGPYGTGKTFTLGQAIKMLLNKKLNQHRLLVCTHSNSAADLYIKEYLDPPPLIGRWSESKGAEGLLQTPLGQDGPPYSPKVLHLRQRLELSRPKPGGC